ncbi:MAG: energy transducer TonB [Chitinophagales bacterium]
MNTMYRFFLVFCITAITSFQLQAITTLQMDSIPKEEIFVIVEEMPQFPEGQEAMHQYIKDNLQYPAEAKVNNLQGTVYLKFVVLSNGNLHDIKVVRGVFPEDMGLNKEARRIIESMPKWIPGKQRGIAVNVAYTLPIRFRLSIPLKPEPVSVSDQDKNASKSKAVNVTQKVKALQSKQKIKMNTSKPSHPSSNTPEIVEGENIELDKVGADGIPIYKTVPEMPFYGESPNDASMYAFKNISYPPSARAQNIQGNVYVGFTVMEDGSIQQVHIKKGIPGGKMCDDEALRVIRSFSNWTPGKIAGKPVRVSYALPVRFRFATRSGRPDKSKTRKIRKVR